MQNHRSTEYLTNMLLAATSAALLYFFACIWAYGSHYIREPNIMILTVETIAVAAILFFAIFTLVQLMVRGKRRGD